MHTEVETYAHLQSSVYTGQYNIDYFDRTFGDVQGSENSSCNCDNNRRGDSEQRSGNRDQRMYNSGTYSLTNILTQKAR